MPVLYSHHIRTTVILTLDSEQRRDLILRRARKRYADITIPHAKRYEYYFTAKPKRIRAKNLSYSDEEIEAKATRKAKQKKVDEIKKKYKQFEDDAKKRKKEPKSKYGTPKASTSKKADKEEPENTGPKNAASTPLPSISEVDSDTPIETLSAMVQEISHIDPVPPTDATLTQESTLDTSMMDMGMQVEVDNDLYTNDNILESTTVPYQNNMEATETDKEECTREATELEHGIERQRRLSYRQRFCISEDLRTTMRGRAGPSDLRNRNEDLRNTMRRKSGPADLRYARLNRDRDLRDQMRPRQRPSSVPPDLRKLREARNTEEAIDYLEQSIIERTRLLSTGIGEREEAIKRLQAIVAGNEEKKEKEYDSNVTSDSNDTNEEGEVAPSEDELTNVRYSESDSSSRVSKPGPSGNRETGPPAAPMKNKPKEVRKKKEEISPIRYPVNTPKKKTEDVPLSKLTTPKRSKTAVKQDLRTRLDAALETSEPEYPRFQSDRGPLESRINREIPPWLPWLPGNTPKNNPWLPGTTGQMKCGTAHRNRTFIEGKTTSRNNSSMTDQSQRSKGQENEEERISEDDISTDEAGEKSNDPKNKKQK